MTDTNRKSAKGKPLKGKPIKRRPVSGHPLFPVVAALWFGALFGLGSLAIRPVLIESVVLQTGVDLIVPAMAPPLGVTARILIALLMASLGAALGAVLALKCKRPPPEMREPQRKRSAAMPNGRQGFTEVPVRRPISVHDEVGEMLGAPGEPVVRRRALAVKHEERPFQPHEMAPLPGGEPQIFDIAATQLAPVAEPQTEPTAAAPLDLGAFAAPDQPAPEPKAFPAMSIPTPNEIPSPAVPHAEPQPVAAPRIFGNAVPDGHIPADFIRAAGFRTSIFETEPAQSLFAERHEQPPAPERPAPSAEPDLAMADLTIADLPITDLASRLQESMARRRAAKGGPVQPAEPPQVASQSAAPDPLPSPPMARQSAFIPPPPIPLPAALSPLSFDEAEEDKHTDFAPLLPRHLSMPAPAPAPVEDAFASLLRVEPARAEFVRIEDPVDPGAPTEPVVIFPGQMATVATMQGAPVAPLPPQVVPSIEPAEAQLALRSALANLQRISGAA